MNINYGRPYWQFNNDKVIERLGATKYLGDFEVYTTKSLDFCYPQSLYYSRHPDKTQGHKQFPFIWQQPSLVPGEPSPIMIGAVTKHIFNKNYRYWNGVYCPHCDEVIVSTYRHHYHECSCGKSFIDGGRSYTRYNPKSSKLVMVDIFKREVLTFGSSKSQAKEQEVREQRDRQRGS